MNRQRKELVEDLAPKVMAVYLEGVNASMDEAAIIDTWEALTEEGRDHYREITNCFLDLFAAEIERIAKVFHF